MRPTVAFLATILLGVSVLACGGASKYPNSPPHVSSNTASASAPASVATNPPSIQSHARSDSDNDSDNDNDDYRYGYAASAADKKAVTALVWRYYMAAEAGDGAKACTMIYSIFAEEIPEVHGEPPGPPALRGSTCAAVMSKLFKQHHRQLMADLAKLQVTDVRIRAHHALVLLGFKTVPPRTIRVHRERRVWKIDALLDDGVG
jgi:hypothetical protein